DRSFQTDQRLEPLQGERLVRSCGFDLFLDHPAVARMLDEEDSGPGSEDGARVLAGENECQEESHDLVIRKRPPVFVARLERRLKKILSLGTAGAAIVENRGQQLGDTRPSPVAPPVRG